MRPLELWHLASLDAPTVALTWAWVFAWANETHLSPQAAAVIGLCVWIVYVGDRLLDTRAALKQRAECRLRERHYFHWRHRWTLVPFAAVAALIAAALILGCIPPVARERDSVLVAASLAYFAGVHRSQLATIRSARISLPPLITKELLVGVLFATGCALPSFGAIFSTSMAASMVSIGSIAFFAALAWLNCHAIDYWESPAKNHLKALFPRLAIALAFIGLVAAILLVNNFQRHALLIASGALSALFLALLDKLRARLASATLRAAADLVLLTPALLIPFGGFLR